MELKIPTREDFRAFYNCVLTEAFPEEELKPLKAMEALWDMGRYRPWCMYEDGNIIGCALVWQREPGWVLFDYLCVTRERRGGGLGAALISEMLQKERGNVLFGEAEIVKFAPDGAMASRRMAFYERNGARRAKYDTLLFGVPYHTLYWAEGAVDEAELLQKHRELYREHFTNGRYEKYISIPWDESMGIPKLLPWEEEI